MASILQNGEINSPTGYKVKPQSYASLEIVGTDLRALLVKEGALEGEVINSQQVLEKILPRYGYNYHIEEDKHMENSAAFTIPEEMLVVVRCSIYEGLFHGNPFARSTIIHELSHLVLEHHISLHRGASVGEHKHFEDSEWQAKALTAAVMMPIAVCSQYSGSPEAIAEVCGTSYSSATYRINNLKRKNLIN